MARKKKAFRSRPRTGMAAAPTKSFSAFSDYVRCEVEKKEISGIIKDFFKKTLNKPDLKIVSDTNSGSSFFDSGTDTGVFKILLLGLGVFFF